LFDKGLGCRFQGVGGSRRALEAFALEEYNSGRLSLPELGRLLGFETRASLDGFLKARGVYQPCTLEDIEQDIRDLHRLGL